MADSNLDSDTEKLNLDLIQSDNNVVRIGMACSFMFLMLFIIPYIQGFVSGKLGFASVNPNKDFTISNVLEVSHSFIQVIIIYIFIALSMTYLAWQNFFVDDKRMLIPLCGYTFGLAMILLIWVNRHKYPTTHYFLTVVVFLVGTIFTTAVYLVYRSFYNSEALGVLRIAAFCSLVVGGLVLISFLIWRQRPRIGKLEMVDVLATLELLHVSILTVTIFYISNMPPLPDELGIVFSIQGEAVVFQYDTPRIGITMKPQNIIED